MEYRYDRHLEVLHVFIYIFIDEAERSDASPCNVLREHSWGYQLFHHEASFDTIASRLKSAASLFLFADSLWLLAKLFRTVNSTAGLVELDNKAP